MKPENNMIDRLLEHMHAHLHKFTDIEEVVGITLNGGLSRGYGDSLSEVDLTIYLTQEGYEKYGDLSLKIPSGIVVIDQQLYDLKIVAFESESKRVMSPLVELWDFNQAEILYDPNGHIKNLKAKWENARSLPSLGSVMFGAYWHIFLAGDIWAYREDPVQGHLMLNEGTKVLIQSIYLVNDKHVPHDKWLYHELDKMGWLPKDVNDIFNDCLMVTDFTMASYINRQNRLKAMYRKIDHFARNFTDGYQDVEVTMEAFYRKLKLLLRMKEMPLDYALSTIGASSLQSDPFRHFVHVVDGKLVVDQERLMSISSDEMYEWHYQVLEAARKK